MDRILPAASSQARFMTPSICTTLREPRSIIEEAEQAAAADNFIAAEALLREAAAAQEATLGPLHPDLANTLNNLGVVCERNGHPLDAERCFRRAVSIATTVLEPGHPFVVTSRKNLRDFCIARRKPIEVPPIELSPSRPAATKTIETQATPRAPRRSARPLTASLLGPFLMLAMILVATLTRLGSTDRTEAEATAMRLSQELMQASATHPSATPPVAASTTIPQATPTPAQPTVVRAQLCATLDEWLCDPADLPVPAGPLFFFTQVKTDHDTMIQHRWYRDDHMMQSVDLPIQAGPSVGYRSFSRLTMDSESAGNWKIELRTEDGHLLHEERFTVR